MEVQKDIFNIYVYVCIFVVALILIQLKCAAYRTDEGKPWVLPVVRQVEQQLAGNFLSQISKFTGLISDSLARFLTVDESLNKEYLPVLGLETMASAAARMLLGPDSASLKEGRASGVQTLSGTGALRVGAEFLARIAKHTVVYSSNPTWGNHSLVFLNGGFQEYRSYRYWDAANKALDLSGMLEAIFLKI